MLESRDRLIRADPFTPMSCRRSIGQERGFQFSNSRFGNNGGRNLFGSPLQLGPMEMSASRAVSMGRFGYGTPRLGRNLIENFESTGNGRRDQGRVRNSPLPYWYRRTPLRDVTSVVNAINGRRTRLSIPGPIQAIAGAPLEHVSLTSPSPMTAVKCCPPTLDHMSKILLGNHVDGESDFLTPQKKLLNSIDKVEKVVMDEFRRMKKTPTAKRAERGHKVRTLMAMR